MDIYTLQVNKGSGVNPEHLRYFEFVGQSITRYTIARLLVKIRCSQQSGFEMCFGPSTVGCWGQNTSRI